MIYQRECKNGLVAKQVATMNKACYKEERVSHF